MSEPTATCTPNACCCPCMGEIARMQRSLRWMRVVLLLVTGVVILAAGIGIGRGQARRGGGPGMPMPEMRGPMMGRPDGPGPQPVRDMGGPQGPRGRGGPDGSGEPGRPGRD